MKTTIALTCFSLALGTAMAEIAWGVVGPQIGEPRSPKPSARLILALAAIFGGVLVLVWLAALPHFAEVSSDAWDAPLLAYAASCLWIGAKLFEKLTAGRARVYLRNIATMLNASIGVVSVIAILILGTELTSSFSSFGLIALTFSVIGAGIAYSRMRRIEGNAPL